MISGGYIIQPRIIQQSDTAHKSPCFRETWVYLLRNASHRDNGKLKRGQLFTTLKKIQDDLFWFVGYRKITYSRRAIEGAIEGMREGGLLVTTKVTHGMIITICKYDYYQDPKNYEGNNEGAYEGNNEGAAKVVNINKNDKKEYIANLSEREQKFRDSVAEFKGKFEDSTLAAFFRYWSEHSKDGKKMRWESEKTWELSKRLITWYKREQSFRKA